MFDDSGRHEVGHNLNIGDDHAGKPEGSTLLAGNDYSRFSGPDLQTMVAYRDERRDLFETPVRFDAAPLAPSAALDLHTAAAGTTTVIDVLANDHDANGDTLRLVSVEPATAAGGTASIVDGKVSYRAPAAGGKDSFQYVIADRCGQTATGIVFTRSGDSGGAVPATAFDPTGGAGPRTSCPVAPAPTTDPPVSGNLPSTPGPGNSAVPSVPTTPAGVENRAVRARVARVKLAKKRRIARVTLRSPNSRRVAVWPPTAVRDGRRTAASKKSDGLPCRDARRAGRARPCAKTRAYDGFSHIPPSPRVLPRRIAPSSMRPYPASATERPAARTGGLYPGVVTNGASGARISQC